MNIIFKYFLLFSAFAIISCSSKGEKLVQQARTFPTGYIGQWAGDLQIMKNGQTVRAIPMEWHLEAISDSLYAWRLIYGEDKADYRDYKLVVSDPASGLYHIDEDNGIVMPLQQFDNRLISWFEVQGQTLIVTYILRAEDVVFTVDVKDSKNPRISGDTIINQDTIPEVRGYPLMVSQKAILRKI